MATTYSSTGNYVATDNYFTSDVTNGPITALSNGTSTNGMYFFGPEHQAQQISLTGNFTSLPTIG
ncbi:MAG: hypothetical protein WDO16_13215 [Bacteroidota bacterium]